MESAARILIPVLLIALIAFAIWAVIELAISFRRLRSTLDNVDETVKKTNPLIDHATLTIDAVNLEIMRVDQILEDVEQLTDSAANAVDAVDKVANAPKEIATSVAGFVRSSVKDSKRKRSADRAMASGEGHALSGGSATQAPADKPSGITIIESPITSKDLEEKLESEEKPEDAQQPTEATEKDGTDAA